MKNALVLALVSLASVNAFAAPKSARIVHMNIDRDAFGGRRFVGGSVSVDLVRREANLHLLPAQIKCPKGRVCPAMIFAPVDISLPLVSKKTGRCEVTYVAETDRRMVDGLRQRLTIVDNASANCMRIPEQRVEAVEVIYQTAGQTRTGAIKTYSTFGAEPFVSAMY